MAAVTRHSPAQIAPALNNIVPGILQAAEKDDEELREGALQVRESNKLKSQFHLLKIYF